MSLTLIDFSFTRNILNGSGIQPEYKINNIPVKLFSWEEPQKKPHDDKSFKVVQTSEEIFSFLINLIIFKIKYFASRCK